MLASAPSARCAKRFDKSRLPIIACVTQATGRVTIRSTRMGANSSDVELLWKSRNDLLEKLNRILAHRTGKRDELQHIHASLRAFDQRYESLVLTELHRDFGLIQAGGFARPEEHLDEVFVSAGENRFGQASLDRLAAHI